MVRSIDKPTIQDIARYANVSQTTVSYVLSGSRYAERISPETRRRIEAAAARLGYVRNSIGAALQRGYSDTLVVLAVTWELAIAHSETTMRISRSAGSKGLTTIVHVAGDDSEAADFLRNMPSLNPFGLFLLWDSPDLPMDNLNELQSKGLPILDLMPSGSDNIASISADREHGFYFSTRHLIEFGHRQIGMVLDTKSRWKTSQRKIAGYKRALEEAGVEFRESLLQEGNGYDFEAGRNGLGELLDRHTDLTAVICINDTMALGAMSAVQDRGLKVPEDISIVGYGASKEGSYFRPGLTSIAIPSFKIAEEGVDMLMKMRREKGYAPESVYEPMDLIINGSTGPAKRMSS